MPALNARKNCFWSLDLVCSGPFRGSVPQVRIAANHLEIYRFKSDSIHNMRPGWLFRAWKITLQRTDLLGSPPLVAFTHGAARGMTNSMPEFE